MTKTTLTKTRTKYNKAYYQSHKEDLLEQKKQYYQDNKEEKKAKSNQHYKDNREEKKAYARERHKDNREKDNIYSKQYHEINKEAARIWSKQYYEENKEEKLAYAKEYRENNREQILEKLRLYSKSSSGRNADRKSKHKRRALKMGTGCKDFNPDEVFIRDGYRCQLCGKKTRPDYNCFHALYPNLDHIVPLSKGGPHTKKNTQCLCRLCNITKHNTGKGDQLRLFG